MIRQNIINEFKTSFAKIKTADGYLSDAGNKISEWRSLNVAEDEPDFINIEDPNCTKVKPAEWNDNADEDSEYKKLTLNISSVTNGKECNEQIRKIRSDIFRAIGETKSALIDKIEYEDDFTEFNFERKRQAGTIITIYVYYYCPKWTE